MSKKNILHILTTSLLLTGPVGCESILVNASDLKNPANTNLIYRQKQHLNDPINTFEAWIRLPSSLPNNVPGGIIAGNFFSTAEGFTGAVDFAVGLNGTFDVFWNYQKMVSSKPVFEYTFSFNNVDLRNNTWTHVAFVNDTLANEARYYVNGVLQETVSISLSEPVSSYPFGFGANWANWYIDLYSRDRSPFQGEISQVTFYKTSLLQSEISHDINNPISESSEGLLGSWLFQNRNEPSTWGDNEIITDKSLRHDDLELVSFNNYVEAKNVEDFDYSFVVVPDMQAMNFAKRQNWIDQSQWIIDNKEKEKIAFVSYLGDMTESKYEKSEDDAIKSTDEYIFASACINMLDGKVPYTFILGNHDYDNWLQKNRNTTQYNKYFKYSKYFGGNNQFFSYMGQAFEEGEMDNYYCNFSVLGVDYLVFSLEQCPRDIVINWVNRIIEENPLKRVIITTHSYLRPNGYLTDSTSALSPARTITYEDTNVGEKMWAKLVSKHPNILAVFCGHECTDEVVYRTDKGTYGNTVHTILVDAQGSVLTSAMNTLLLVKVNERTKTMSLCYYSPEYGACFLKQNQFTISFKDKFNPTIG